MKQLLLFVVLFIAATVANSQQQYTGLWQGKLSIGQEITFVFKVTAVGDSLSGTLDIPEQGAKELKLSRVHVVNDSLKMELSQYRISFTGKLQADTALAGYFHQGVNFPLTLKKIDKIVVKDKPQTPRPPFPYKTEDITYVNSDSSITYGATITMPQGKGPFAAVLLLTGSGQQNRDEEIMGHKPFAVLADYLTRAGFIVLRVDDRGVGKTTGDPMIATTKDFAADAMVSLNYLMSRKEVDTKNVGLLGHSEGGMIAQLIASQRKDIKFVVSLAGPGVNVRQLMSEQNKAVLKKMGFGEKALGSYLPLYDSLTLAAISFDSALVREKLLGIVDRWVAATDKGIVVGTTGIKDDSTKMGFVNNFAEVLTSPWFRYFLSYEPAAQLNKIKAHVLALNGDQDVQVLSKSNLAGLEAGLKGSAKSFEKHELPGLNHLFQQCKTCTVQEYGQLEETISPRVLELIAGWMKKVSSAK